MVRSGGMPRSGGFTAGRMSGGRGGMGVRPTAGPVRGRGPMPKMPMVPKGPGPGPGKFGPGKPFGFKPGPKGPGPGKFGPGGGGFKTPKMPKGPGHGFKPAPKPHPKHGHPKGKPHPHFHKPGNWPWWQPFFPNFGFWPDWAPGWWPNWGVWATDVVFIERDPYVVIWIDRCSDEYALALANGTFSVPEFYDGYPVIVRWTCGDVVELEEAAAGFGAEETPSALTGLLWLGAIVGAGYVAWKLVA